LNDAIKKDFSFGGNLLSWVSADTKLCHKCGSPKHMAIKCPKITRRPQENSNDKQESKSKFNNADRLQKLYHKYRPAGVRISNRSSTAKNALSYSEVAKSNKGKQKEITESNTNKLPQTVDHSQHNPENRNINTNSNLERKLDLILNKLDSMQKSINNLNDRIKKLEE